MILYCLHHVHALTLHLSNAWHTLQHSAAVAVTECFKSLFGKQTPGASVQLFEPADPPAHPVANATITRRAIILRYPDQIQT
jgi:hypothetical protein